MEIFIWDDKYLVNIKEIDDQHKKLVDLINKLNEAMYEGQGCEMLEVVLKDLVIYTKSHFANEENLLSSNGYPDFLKHKEKHDELTGQVIDLQKQFEGGRIMITLQVMKFLKDWLSNHILDIDKKYAPFLKDKGVV
ncbi:MAG: bacteriohemerythrin [Candidatus Anammoxibacter sp.]